MSSSNSLIDFAIKQINHIQYDKSDSAWKTSIASFFTAINYKINWDQDIKPKLHTPLLLQFYLYTENKNNCPIVSDQCNNENYFNTKNEPFCIKISDNRIFNLLYRFIPMLREYLFNKNIILTINFENVNLYNTFCTYNKQCVMNLDLCLIIKPYN